MPKISFATSLFLDRWVCFWTLFFLAVLPVSLALTEISFVLAFMGWLILRWRVPRPLLLGRKMFMALLVFVSLCVISFFWSEFPRESFRGIFKVLQQFFLFWLVSETLVTEQRQRLAFNLLALIFVFLGLDGIWQYAFGKDLVRQIPYEAASAGPRISASFRNYGLLASFVITFLPLLFSQWGREGAGKLRAFALGGLVLGLLLLFWTRVRGAWIAFLVGLALFLWFTKQRIYLALLVLALIPLFFLLPHSMRIHLDIQGKEQSLVERVYLWDRAIQVIAARPWTGIGINTYDVAHQKYDRIKNWRVPGYYAHNGYLQMAAETGLPTLVCFLAFLGLYFKNAFQFLREGFTTLHGPVTTSSKPRFLGPFGDTERHGIRRDNRDETASRTPLQTIEQRTLLGILTGLVNFLILCLIDTVFHNSQAVMGFWFLAGWGIAYQTANQGA